MRRFYKCMRITACYHLRQWRFLIETQMNKKSTNLIKLKLLSPSASHHPLGGHPFQLNLSAHLTFTFNYSAWHSYPSIDWPCINVCSPCSPSVGKRKKRISTVKYNVVLQLGKWRDTSENGMWILGSEWYTKISKEKKGHIINYKYRTV